MYNVLLYQQGGTLYLDEPFEAQPSAATITIRTLDNLALTTIHSSFSDVENVTASVEDLVLTLPAANKGARLLSPTDTTGTIPTLTDPHLRLLIESGGRKIYAKVNEYYTSGSDVTSFRIDQGLDFDIQAGATAKVVRVKYTVNWSAVTSDFVGRVKVEWKVTVNGVVQKIVQIYDVVKQILKQAATWKDVVVRRAEVDKQVSEVKDKESIVTQAWEDLIQELYTLGIRHNLIIQDGSTVLRDATVLQAIINLTLHYDLPIPLNYQSQGDLYVEMLERQKRKILNGFSMPIDDDQNSIIDADEEKAPRKQVWLNSNAWRRGRD